MSGFIKDTSDYSSEQPSTIDFDDAIRLHGSGSICEIYRTKWQRRDVFVKRLKEEFRNKPLYLDALDKEFEVGVKLKHPSLPEYREFHRDYVIMDYIDGMTLAEMLKRRDPWLSNEKNVVKLFKQLIEVVYYLHCHNVVHCDIKPDNIMITANNHNLILIDLDKCYTDSLNDTSGSPSLFGLANEERGRTTLDMYGIGMVAKTLKTRVRGFKFRRYKKFIKECFSKDANLDTLNEILDYDTSAKRYKYWYIVIALIVFLFAVLYPFKNTTPGQEQPKDVEESPINVEPVVISGETQPDESPVAPPTKPAEKSQTVAERQVNYVTPEELEIDAQKKAAIYDNIVQPYFDKLRDSLDCVLKLQNDSTITGEQLYEAMSKFIDMEDEYLSEAYGILEESFPGISDRAVWRVLSYSKAYTGYKRYAEPAKREYGHFMEKLLFPGGVE